MSCGDICTDSRAAREGSLFFCLRGANADGHDHAREAYDAGCRDFCAEREVTLPADARVTICGDTKAALAEKAAEFFGYPARSLVMIGVTGTKGKTGTLCCAREMLEESGMKCGTIGTLGIEYDGVHADLPNTTPDAVTIHKTLAEMVKRNVKAVITEVSSQALKERRVHGIEFDIGVFTNFSPDHISEIEHATVEEYKECKAKLFSACRNAFLNGDDAEYGYFLKSCKKNAFAYGTSEKCAYRAANARFFKKGGLLFSEFDLYAPGIEGAHLISPVPGMPGVYNTLCAASFCSFLGADVSSLVRGAAKARAAGRFELYECGNAYVMIDYAHNELAVKNLFSTVSLYPFARKIAVFGCGGERSCLRRRAMGKIISENADICVVTEDNPRSEDVEKINADIAEGMKGAECGIIYINDRERAIEYALNTARRNDIVLLIGKGNENYMEKNGRKLPFCERDIIRSFKAKLRDN